MKCLSSSAFMLKHCSLHKLCVWGNFFNYWLDIFNFCTVLLKFLHNSRHTKYVDSTIGMPCNCCCYMIIRTVQLDLSYLNHVTYEWLLFMNVILNLTSHYFHMAITTASFAFEPLHLNHWPVHLNPLRYSDLWDVIGLCFDQSVFICGNLITC